MWLVNEDLIAASDQHRHGAALDRVALAGTHASSAIRLTRW